MSVLTDAGVTLASAELQVAPTGTAPRSRSSHSALVSCPASSPRTCSFAVKGVAGTSVVFAGAGEAEGIALELEPPRTSNIVGEPVLRALGSRTHHDGRGMVDHRIGFGAAGSRAIRAIRFARVRAGVS